MGGSKGEQGYKLNVSLKTAIDLYWEHKPLNLQLMPLVIGIDTACIMTINRGFEFVSISELIKLKLIAKCFFVPYWLLFESLSTKRKLFKVD